MRITLLSPSLSFGGGTERMSVALGSEFAARGAEVDFVVLHDDGADRLPLPEAARLVHLGTARTRSAFVPLVRYLRQARPDALVAHLWPLTCMAVAAWRLASVPGRVVVVDHNTLSQQYRRHGRRHAAGLRWSIAASYRFADARVAVSAGVADDLARLSGLARSAFSVINNPVEIREASAAQRQAAEAAWRGFTGPRLITVGRLKPQKNHHLLIDAFKLLTRRIEARLMIVGGGPLEAEIRDRLQREALGGRVVLAGQVAEPAALYQSAELFVLASDYEGFGNVLVEALGHALPVVSTDCPSGPADILERGRLGRLVPVGDAEALAAAMEEALGAPHDREALRRRAQDFAPARIAERYLDILLPEDARADLRPLPASR